MRPGTIAALNFTGFDGISTLAEEVSEPEKNVGRAILIALVVIGTVFFLQTYIVCLIEPDYNKFNASTALFDACAVAIGDWFRIVLLVVNILAVGIVFGYIKSKGYKEVPDAFKKSMM